MVSNQLTRLRYYDPPSPAAVEEEALLTSTETPCTSSTNISAGTSSAGRLGLKVRRSVSFALPDSDESSGEIPATPSSPSDSVESDFKVSPRQERKCRNRADTVSRFEAKAFKILSSPQLPSEHLAELHDGDLYLNWIDRDMMVCQVWISTSGQSSGWKSMQWGSRTADGSKQRLIITAMGFPSFVAESTWKKKYKLSNPRIKVYPRAGA